MKEYFSVGEAAKVVHTTSETLRHYDRIGLVKPSKKDPWTHYRYYTQQDLVRLNTVRALQLMDLPLQEIKKVLEYDDLEKIVDFLTQAEKKAEEKIAALEYSKSKIQLAKADYEKKLRGQQRGSGAFVKDLPARVILLSDTLEAPTVENLWNYLSHFYNQVTPALKEQFSFEDLAGVYTENGGLKAVRPLCPLCTGRGAQGAAGREVPVRRLHRRKPAGGTGRAGPKSESGVRHRPGLYGAACGGVRHSAMEL